MKKLNNKGSVAIILCILITALFGFTAYVIDIGMVYAEKMKLSNAIDSAVLAAAMELPNSDTKANEKALEYLQKNNEDPNLAAITISSDHKNIQIVSHKNVKHFFAPLIGIDSSNVNTQAKAVIGPIKSVKSGLRPFAVQKYDFNYGELVTLKTGAGDGYNGNYGAVVLGGQGESVFLANALYGYNGTVLVGSYIDTEPGNMSGATTQIKNYINSECSTFDNIPRDSIRLWTIPLVDTLAVNGQKAVHVVGFAKFYVEDVTGDTAHIDITGRFVRFVSSDPIDISLDDTGALGVKLSK